MIDDWCVLPGDCRDRLADLDAESIDAVVTDPPYELGFMGKAWDKSGVPYQVVTWAAVYRVLKPGGYLLAFGGTRTHHRMTCAIEDAGFEIRDCLQWIYGSGFPKSLDVSKAIDGINGSQSRGFRVAGNDGRKAGFEQDKSKRSDYGYRYTPASTAAQQWQGWGTALKPAYEPIVLARKPLVGTVAQNVQQYGTGAINVDGCRVNPGEVVPGGGNGQANNGGRFGAHETSGTRPLVQSHSLGRWPANILHDGSEEVVALFPQTNGGSSNGPVVTKRDRKGFMLSDCKPGGVAAIDSYGDTGSAAVLEGKRFVGIELEAETAAAAERRIRRRVDLPLFQQQEEIAL